MLEILAYVMMASAFIVAIGAYWYAAAHKNADREAIQRIQRARGERGWIWKV